jgi:hypothetical protein
VPVRGVATSTYPISSPAMFSITFGSLGDIIAVAQIVQQVIEALNNSTGAPRNYQDLICQLQTLHRTLLEAHQLITQSKIYDPERLPTSADGTILWEVGLCKSIMEDLLEKIAKYGKNLCKGGSGSIMRDSWRKISWQFLKKEDVTSFTERIDPHITAINMLLHISTRYYPVYSMDFSLLTTFPHSVRS